MEPDREAMVCDNSMHFSERTLICIMTNIIQIVTANVLPTTENNKKF
jgi:hypothetical protein